MSQLIRFEKIVPEGKAMGRLADGRAVFAIGPLPGELARVGIRKQRKRYAEAVLHDIIEPSAKRNLIAEDHCLVCSPWQGVEYTYQLELKRAMLGDAYAQQHLSVPINEFVPSPARLGYRNRLDFSVARIDGQLQLAFHARGSWDEFIALPEGCALGDSSMNQAARNLLIQLNDGDFQVEPATITVRYAPSTGQMLTILTTAVNASWKTITAKKLGSFLVASPLPGSGASGKIEYQSGNSYVTETIAGVDLAYPHSAFFQSNIPVFEKSLEYITKVIVPSSRIIELYSGVGAIGLPLAAQGVSVQGIEVHTEAVAFAERNARANAISSYSAEAVAAEHMNSTLLNNVDCVIVDPPRAGLHPRVIRWLLEAHPKQIIYLSCNPVTQARDIARLLPTYRCTSLIGFDFYPGTLHLEALAVLS
ncbi:MAG TPA: methyltransferase [Candidatus Saccharimonadia bacterium]